MSYAADSLLINESIEMNVIYRAARKEDSYRIAELDYIASGGASEYLFHDLVPDSTPIQVVAYGLENDFYPHSFRSAIVAESNDEVIGMALSFPTKFHGINDEMRNFLPFERLEHFKAFFSARVDDSYYIDAICVDSEYRNKGIGKSLLEKTIEKARKEGFSLLSLIAFVDNHKAIKFYNDHGFVALRQVELKKHALIPHTGGCLLMRAET
ncbi:MAG: GNAT family N-acetyltransferase [Candidatus Thiodiazotropha sp.]